MYNLLAVGALLETWWPGTGIAFVFEAMTMFRCEVVPLQTLNPSCCLLLQIPKAQQAGQDGVELLSIQILLEMLQGLHNCQQLLTGHTVVPLGLGQSFAELDHNPFASVLYLGQ